MCVPSSLSEYRPFFNPPSPHTNANRYGEVVDINLVREKDTGKSKGFAFIAYEDQRSTVLAVDNFNGIKVRPKCTT